MIRPSDLGIGVLGKLERAVYKLHSLYTLLSESFIVQSLKRVREIGMGQEVCIASDYSSQATGIKNYFAPSNFMTRSFSLSKLSTNVSSFVSILMN
jgi:hypothetical protein